MRIIILIVLVIFGLTAVACTSEAPSPADTQTTSLPTPDVPATVEAGIRATREAETAIDATVEAKVAVTLTTSTPTPTPAAATLSLDEYLSLCAPTEQDLADDATYGELSSVLAAEADRLEALTPPAQLSEWHSQYVESLRKVQAILDTQPKDDVMDFAGLILIAAVSADLEEQLGEVSARLAEDVRQQMIEASCIDPEDLPENYETVPDDHGNNFESATRIAIGEAVAIEFEDPDDKELFVFLVEPGAEYVFTLHWESWNRWSYPSRPIMALFDAGGHELARP